MAYLSGYTKRFPVTIDSTKVPADLTDFPVYVDLSSAPAGFWATVSNGGGDIRVTKSDETTEVAREVVSCDTTAETGELHFKAAGTLSSSTDTVFYIYYNGTSSDYAVTDTFGRNAVWVNHHAVWHGIDSSSTVILDSTGNGEDATKGAANQPNEVTGKIEESQDFSGGNYYADFPNPPGFRSDQTGTFTAWMKYPHSGTFRALMSMGDASATSAFAYFGVNTDNKIWMDFRLDTSANNLTIASATTPAANTWTFVAIRSDNANPNDVFINGAKEGSPTRSATGTSSTSDWFADVPDIDNPSIGSLNRTSRGTYYDGEFDEMRVAKNGLSGDWLSAEYNNQNSAASFYTAGAEETDGGGGVTARNAIFAFGGM